MRATAAWMVGDREAFALVVDSATMTFLFVAEESDETETSSLCRAIACVSIEIAILIGMNFFVNEERTGSIASTIAAIVLKIAA
jgi:hypothetical protein